MNLPSENGPIWEKRRVRRLAPAALYAYIPIMGGDRKAREAGGVEEAPGKPGRYAGIMQRPRITVEPPHPVPLAGIQAVVHNTVSGVVRSSWPL